MSPKGAHQKWQPPKVAATKSDCHLLLGRELTLAERGVFEVMYSEHCSYQSSKPVLKLFPRSGKGILIGAGEENAGVVDIGDGLCVAFKIESHNHPSAVEPFQGAATGVGGILRDIFTMGARPILLMNSLRFGNLDSGMSRHLMKGVVGGIAFYGNCVGVPTVGGEVYFDNCYEANPLVNCLALGIARHEEIVRGRAEGVGNPVFYVGSATGRDGMGGASFASKEITKESERDRPAVQVGDPFTEKLLMEAVLELLRTGAVVGIQDMGAAGLTCSTAETAARGGSGIEIDTSLVPQRESGMMPHEILLSESQERMLVILKKEREADALRIFEKWDLHACPIGEVTGTGLMVVKHKGEEVVSISVRAITTDAPVYEREKKRPRYLDHVRPIKADTLPPAGDLTASLLKLLDSPTIASKHWVYHQYDHMVRTGTTVLPGSDSAVIRIKGTKKKIAVTTDGNATYCYLDPYEGGKIAVAEAARNLAATGARPLAITNCLNFGNPMKPEIFWQFYECVRGMADAASALGTPVTGGNVSFYNESPKGAIDPTPVVGMIGLLEGHDPVPSFFQGEGDLVALLGETKDELGGSEFMKVIHQRKEGLPPRLHLDEASSLNTCLLALAERGLIRSCHDLSEGGLGVALAECCIGDPDRRWGVTIRLKHSGLSLETLLFSETQSRALVSLAKERWGEFERIASAHRVPVAVIGEVQGKILTVNDRIKAPLEVLSEAWRNGITNRLNAVSRA